MHSDRALSASSPLSEGLKLAFLPERLAGVVVTAAQAARRLVFEGPLEIEWKPDGSPVTNVDLTVNAMLTRELSALLNVPVISEESIPSLEIRRAARTAWLIDPIDNTKAMVEGRFEDSSINVALLRDGEPVLGMAFYFGSNQGILGVKERGAFLVTEDTLVALTPPPVTGLVRFVAYRTVLSEMSEQTRSAHERVVGPGAVILHGTSLPQRLRAVMLGEADVYIEPRSISEWDIVPGFAVVLAAQGSGISLRTGAPLRFNSETLRADPFLLARPGVDVAQMVSQLKSNE